MKSKKRKKLETLVILSTLWFIGTLPLPWIINNPDVNQTQLLTILPIIGIISIPFVVLAIVWTLKPELTN